MLSLCLCIFVLNQGFTRILYITLKLFSNRYVLVVSPCDRYDQKSFSFEIHFQMIWSCLSCKEWEYNRCWQQYAEVVVVEITESSRFFLANLFIFFNLLMQLFPFLDEIVDSEVYFCSVYKIEHIFFLSLPNIEELLFSDFTDIRWRYRVLCTIIKPNDIVLYG